MEKRMPYPEPVNQRTGGKVSWNYYTDRETADACAKAAIHNARLDAALGYDFGFCVPGTVRECKDGTWEVCLP